MARPPSPRCPARVSTRPLPGRSQLIKLQRHAKLSFEFLTMPGSRARTPGDNANMAQPRLLLPGRRSKSNGHFSPSPWVHDKSGRPKMPVVSTPRKNLPSKRASRDSLAREHTCQSRSMFLLREVTSSLPRINRSYKTNWTLSDRAFKHAAFQGFNRCGPTSAATRSVPRM